MEEGRKKVGRKQMEERKGRKGEIIGWKRKEKEEKADGRRKEKRRTKQIEAGREKLGRKQMEKRKEKRRRKLIERRIILELTSPDIILQTKALVNFPHPRLFLPI
jgi:hypothetical protein